MRLSPIWLLIICTSSALVAYLVTRAMAAVGHSSPVLPLSSAITLGGIGLIVLALGIMVWADQRKIARATQQQRPNTTGNRQRRLHPLQAVRVVAAGQACAYAGALIAGWHTGVLVDLAPAAGLGAPNATSSLVMMIGGLLWVIIGFVVETLCRIPPDASGKPPGGRTQEGFEEEPGAGYARRAEFPARPMRHIHVVQEDHAAL